ncbi:MAG: nitrile hydratase accessory protein [Candidatus Dormibacteraceae bacterium]
MTDVDREIADLAGPAALPRKNGELVFLRPWEGRAFGMAVALRAAQPYTWKDFARHLEREIAESKPDTDGTLYYERWLGAFEHLLLERGLLTRGELDRRVREYEEGAREEVF